MADITHIDDYDNKEKTVPVDFLVQLCGSKSYDDGIIERTATELDNTRSILARLINALADKKLFTNDELLKIIKG